MPRLSPESWCQDLVQRADAKTITAAVDGFGKSSGLDLDHLVGKGFDGAATMSGHVSGVSVRLQQLHPRAKYLTHCRNHAIYTRFVNSRFANYRLID